MPKILKPYTIIPPELYIQRDADKQVKNIITDMGRPGYVLVSRQMGKTNLLLNAKRKLQTENDIFIYIDLSNSFPDAKSCFENIINTAIEAYPSKFQFVSKLIFERRLELKDTTPHKQHTNELRSLLNALNGGKLVIILDEIDALIKTDYSDQIFSQIRSSYFAERVNYEEFNNLTYLLSGVIEPNEIIKNHKISPFNIGQKIYLNDFSRTEFDNFLSLSKLILPHEVVDRIFYWTNGNPRMTWDVCSEVEDILKHQPSITINVIDKIINNLYFKTFDRPPIDTIREIVNQNVEIRNSIIEIEYKKGKNISDKIKSKLYLAGIINYDEDDIHIKNEIIRSCLNNDLTFSQSELGNPKRALELAEQALAIQLELHGNKHPDVAQSLNNIAGYTNELGNPKRALELAEQALAIQLKLHGNKHPDVAQSFNNIASYTDKLGNSKRALELAEQALSIQCELFGDKHATIATSLNNIAGYTNKLGNPKRALELAEQAITIRRELFGEKHPDIAQSLNNIANYTSALGNPKRALELVEQALTILRELFGEKHPDIAASLINIANYTSELGNPKRALALAEQALAIQRELFGDKHPDVATSIINVASITSTLGNPKRALELAEQALAIQREVLGDKHPDTAASLHSVASYLSLLGKNISAYEYAKKAFEIEKDIFGSQHNKTLLTARLLSQLTPKGFRLPSSKTTKGKKKKRR